MMQDPNSINPSSQCKTQEIDFSQLHMNTLRRNKKHFKVVTKAEQSKAQLSKVIYFFM